MRIKPFFKEEADVTIKTVIENKKKGKFSFVLVTDSHLSDNAENTCENIKYVDEKVDFDCMVHMGDFLCGNIPEKVSRRLLREEIEKFRSSTKSNILYAVQGNHDGYRDEAYKGQTVPDMALDENWYEDTKYMDENENLKRPGIKPYYYVDIPEHKLRFIVVATNSYIIDKEKKEFKKCYGITTEELEWIAGEALKFSESGWTVMAFSHRSPVSGLDGGNQDEQGGRELKEILFAFKNKGVCSLGGKTYDFGKYDNEFACWCFGDTHGDSQHAFDGITYISTASETAYIPQLWTVNYGGFPSPRDLGTKNEDVWDAVTVSLKEKTVYFTRFGAGEDRIVKY